MTATFTAIPKVDSESGSLFTQDFLAWGRSLQLLHGQLQLLLDAAPVFPKPVAVPERTLVWSSAPLGFGNAQLTTAVYQ